MIVLNGETLRGAARARRSRRSSIASGCRRQARGVAVAVDGEVVPRACWEVFALAEDARVEVLTAMQGG